MINKFPRILFFINSTNPTPKEIAEAMKLGPNVSFRNATMISETEAFENCDGVAGAVPKRYAEAVFEKTGKRRFPKAEDALAAYGRQMDELVSLAEEKAELVGGEAPKLPTAPETKPPKPWVPNA